MENDLSEYCVRSKAMPGCFRSRHCHFRLSRLCSTAMAAGFFERRGIRAPAAVFRQHEQGLKIQTRPAGDGGKIVKNRANPIFWPSTSAGSVLALCWSKLRVPSVSSSESASPGSCSEAVGEMMNSRIRETSFRPVQRNVTSLHMGSRFPSHRLFCRDYRTANFCKARAKACIQRRGVT